MNSFASPQTLATLPVRPTVDDLYSRVLDAIFELRIHSASRFTEESLALMFGARRSDMRDVLTRLSHQQIIILRVNHRPRVAELDVEQTRQTLHARRLAEIMLVRLACQRPCAQDLKRLRTLVENERQCAERGRAIRLSGEFHLQLAQMAGNAPLAHFLDSLIPQTSLAIAQCEEQTRSCCAWQAHLAIVSAIEHGNAATAAMLINRHMDHLEQTLLNTTREHCATG
ncbi:GntR family transcriptional regulator [Pseudomonas laurylsulfativorans]|uniref:GntR family transcriptional regulator n=1 Tax=Pseudomonas laurylsulfativorans TaxID=1943631 RepID=A0A2S3VK74_9PSED|nr:GntR family transcriptional regulator [Pseudomonas laurylsulfativorans]POF40364.1 GntR family transcriptional regulator [Pseudomonas laurylsulfativorans]